MFLNILRWMDVTWSTQTSILLVANPHLFWSNAIFLYGHTYSHRKLKIKGTPWLMVVQLSHDVKTSNQTHTHTHTLCERLLSIFVNQIPKGYKSAWTVVENTCPSCRAVRLNLRTCAWKAKMSSAYASSSKSNKMLVTPSSSCAKSNKL